MEKILEESNYTKKLGEYLMNNNISVSTAESCTGGLISAKLVEVSGISSVFNEGFITYSNDSKQTILGVKKRTLKKYGAVSQETAKEMCYGVCKLTNAKLGISATGIAGPDGGTIDKPVGTVYIGIYYNRKIVVKHYVLKGDREEVRNQTANMAIKLAYRVVKTIDNFNS